MRTPAFFAPILAVTLITMSTAQAGMTWQPATTPPASEFKYLRSVVWGNGEFVAVGDDDIAMTSPDGIVWSAQSTGLLRGEANDIIWNGSQYVAVGYESTMGNVFARALTSTDGATWTIHSPAGPAMTAVAWNDTASPGYFLALGDPSGPTSIWSWFSVDGSVWIPNFINVGTDRANRLLWHNNKFIAVGENGLIMTSPDGFAWTRHNSGTNRELTSITYGNGVYVAVGMHHTILTSPDAITWSMQSSGGSPEHLSGVDWNGIIFVAVGIAPLPDPAFQNCIISSRDGINWHPQPYGFPRGAFWDVAWNGARWVGVWSDLEIAYSDDTTPVELQSFVIE